MRCLGDVDTGNPTWQSSFESACFGFLFRAQSLISTVMHTQRDCFIMPWNSSAARLLNGKRARLGCWRKENAQSHNHFNIYTDREREKPPLMAQGGCVLVPIDLSLRLQHDGFYGLNLLYTIQQNHSHWEKNMPIKYPIKIDILRSHLLSFFWNGHSI